MNTAEFWEYDSRLGRRLNVDPVTYSWKSSYATFDNNPIYYADPLGLFATEEAAKEFQKKHKIKGKITYGEHGYQINQKDGAFYANNSYNIGLVVVDGKRRNKRLSDFEKKKEEIKSTINRLSSAFSKSVTFSYTLELGLVQANMYRVGGVDMSGSSLVLKATVSLFE